MRIFWFVTICFHLCSLGSALTHVRLNNHAYGSNVLDQQSLVGAGAVSRSRSLTRVSSDAVTLDGTSASVSDRPVWAKGPWPPVTPLYNKQNQRTEHEMQYQYRTCNNWAEWDEYYRQEQERVQYYYRYVIQEQNKINQLPVNQQNSHENQYKLQQIHDTYKQLIKELTSLTEKATKSERVKACLPNVKSAISNSISDGVKEGAAIEAAIQEMKTKDLLAQTQCALVQKAQDYKGYAIGVGAACGMAIGQLADSVLGTGVFMTGLCGASGAYLGHEAVQQVKTIIQQHMKIPEPVLQKIDTQLITSQLIDAQCKDRKEQAKAELQRLGLSKTP